MAIVKDFRKGALSSTAINNSGKYIGRHAYWRLYSIENIFRITIHSVLLSQGPYGHDWWDFAVDEDIRKRAKRFQENYQKKPWHGNPGAHAIYYIDLKDLGEIIRANANLFYAVISDLDKWLVGIEDIRLPRNVIAHMNFPSKIDMNRIDVFHEDCLKLIENLNKQGILVIP